MTDTVIVLTTWPDAEQIRAHANDWLSEGLVACVNILPQMTSLYQWEGDMQQGTEHQIIMKTSARKTEALKQAIVNVHPYSCPEILVINIADGHPAYLNWITGQTE